MFDIRKFCGSKRKKKRPDITDIKALLKIYCNQRAAWLTKTFNEINNDYWKSVLSSHYTKICCFNTKDELVKDIEKYLKITFTHWYYSL